MRLAFVTRRYPPAVGGMETFLGLLARELGERHEVTVFSQAVETVALERLMDTLRPVPTFEPFQDGPVTVRPWLLSRWRRAALLPTIVDVVPVIRRYSFGELRRATAALYGLVAGRSLARESAGADLVHVWGTDLLAAAGLRAATRLGVPSVISPFAHERQWGDDPASARAYARASAVVGLLDAEASLYVRLGASAETVHVCGVCSTEVRGSGPELRAQHGIRGGLVLFLGVRRYYKGFDLLLDAIPPVLDELPDTRFAFVGPGDPLPPGQPAAIDVGWVSDADRADWIAAADIVCLPSRHEIMPVSILEAWSAGKPVVTSDIATLRELVGRSGGGEAVRPDASAVAAALVGLLRNADARREFGARGRAWWEAHATPAAVAACYTQIYESLLEDRSAAAR